VGDPGRTGPNEARRQRDLELGIEPERTDTVKASLVVKLTEQEAQIALQRALATGYKRDNPNWAWTNHERGDAIRHWVAGLIEEDLKT
jgi:hypothetical protein